MKHPSLVAALAWLAASTSAASAAVEPRDCRVGAYVLGAGEQLVVTPSDGENLRYRFVDGRAGKLFATGSGGFEGGDGWSVREPVTMQARFGSCAEGRITLQRKDAAPVVGVRAPLRVSALTFESAGERLYGELVLPAAGRPKAIVVLQYGSGDDSAVRYNYVQHLLPLKGIGVLVFDKRGTGRSSGRLTANFTTLADDLGAAVRALRARPESVGVPIGLMGESQGGWVAPLTAAKVPVDFVVVSYGLAVSIVGEDRAEVVQSVRDRGFDEAAVSKALALHEAATRVIDSWFERGVDDLERLKAEYRTEPWFAEVGGDYTSLLAATPAEKFPEVKAAFDLDFDINYDPEPTLAKSRTPMLWVLAGRDTEAPHEETKAILRRLQAAGSPIDLVVFPNADHGIIEQEDGPQGRRDAGRHSEGYFDLLADWIVSRRLSGRYGTAEMHPRP